MKKIYRGILTGTVFISAFLLFFAFKSDIFAQTCARLSSVGSCTPVSGYCQIGCPAGYSVCGSDADWSCASGPYGCPCGAKAVICQVLPSGDPEHRCCCPNPTPTVFLTSCQGQYFGKSQCDAKGLSTYGRGGTCQLNPALGTINPSNLNDPINYWKWSYCKLLGPTATPTPYLCGRGNCSGCCMNNICYPGTATNTCGIGGNLCSACPSGRVCSNQTCVAAVTPTSIPTISPVSCQGQYFGEPQCKDRAQKTYGIGGICKLNPALGTINPNNYNDPINYWKWSYCR